VKTILVLALASGCSWTQFDDLSDQTPARAEEKPDGIKSSEYGIAIAGATAPTETSGGKIAILSSGPGSYSTLELDAGGTAQNLGDNETLGQHTIDSLTAAATLLFDGTSQVALIDNSNVGTIVAITGSVDGLSVDQQVPTSVKPDATAFVNGEVVVTATAGAGMPNLFSVKGTAVVSCSAVDGATSMPLTASAIAIDGTKLWVYTKAGAFFGYDLTALNAAATCTALAPNTATVTTGAAANGAHVDIVASKFAVLTAYDLPSTTAGAVTVVDLSTMMMVGTPIAAQGVKSAAFDTFDGQGVVVLGYPNRNDGGTTGVGAVDLHRLDVTAGTLEPTPAQTLTIPGAGADHVFGRAVTTTKYNGKSIVVVAADNTVYSYYATQLYSKR
jgi:hypothetical protein